MRVVIAGGMGLTGRGRLADDRRLFHKRFLLSVVISVNWRLPEHINL
jgi:hypothetical protein